MFYHAPMHPREFFPCAHLYNHNFAELIFAIAYRVCFLTPSSFWSVKNRQKIQYVHNKYRIEFHYLHAKLKILL